MKEDKQNIITKCTLLPSNFKKKIVAMSYHRICEAVKVGGLNLRYLKGQ